MKEEFPDSKIVPQEYFEERRFFPGLSNGRYRPSRRTLGQALEGVKAQDMLNPNGTKTVIEFPTQ